MADGLQTVTSREEMNHLGNLREDIGSWTPDGTEGWVPTRLSFLYSVEIALIGSTSVTAGIEAQLNTKTDGGDEDDGGFFWYDGSTASETLRYRAIGK
jgi:hypothetical protein